MSVAMTVRIGQGFDVHPFDAEANAPLVLGGVSSRTRTPLRGHSDADVVAHAVIDALLGAAGLGDIGTHFSDTDPDWRVPTRSACSSRRSRWCGRRAGSRATSTAR